MKAWSISAYIPCYNGASTIRRAVQSLLGQTLPAIEVFVVDDGSVDGSAKCLDDLPVRVIRHGRNRGRGAARARAMAEARGELVLCCDATNMLEPMFCEKIVQRFDDPSVSGVFGRFVQPPAANVVERWRGRHLLKVDAVQQARHGVVLSTYGALVRADAVRGAGGYNAGLHHNEDGELGARLLAAGWDVVYDPSASVVSIASNTLLQVLERYWRWYAGKDEETTWRGYWKNIGYSIKGMASADLRAGDPLSVPISLFTPHYQFWKSRCRRRVRRTGR